MFLVPKVQLLHLHGVLAWVLKNRFLKSKLLGNLLKLKNSVDLDGVSL